jgi:uncharacterized Zn finger protein
MRKKEEEMRCRRCGGMVVTEKFLGSSGDSLGWDYLGTRCLCCGRIEDPLILAQQRKKDAAASGFKS